MDRWPYHPQKKIQSGVKSPFSQFDVSSKIETKIEEKEKQPKKQTCVTKNKADETIKRENKVYRGGSPVQTRKRKRINETAEILKEEKKEKIVENILPSFDEFLYGVMKLENN
jgi:hypothetical protein